MERIAIHVPECLPDGSPVDEQALAALEERFWHLASNARLASGGLSAEGFTVLSNVVGAWRSPSGKTYREPMRVYCLDVLDAQSVIEEVRSVAAEIRVVLEQEAVYLTISPFEAMSVTESIAA